MSDTIRAQVEILKEGLTGDLVKDAPIYEEIKRLERGCLTNEEEVIEKICEDEICIACGS